MKRGILPAVRAVPPLAVGQPRSGRAHADGHESTERAKRPRSCQTHRAGPAMQLLEGIRTMGRPAQAQVCPLSGEEAGEEADAHG